MKKMLEVYKKRRTVSKDTAFFVLAVLFAAGFISRTAGAYQSSSSPVLELDAEIPYLVGDQFTITVTAFDRSNGSITLSVIFDADERFKVYEQTRAYFVNQIINCSTRGEGFVLESGKDHNITVLAENDFGDTRAITQDLEIDRTDPTIDYFRLTDQSIDEEGNKFVGYGDTVLLSWLVDDDHFKAVKIYQDEQFITSYGSEEGTYRMSFQLPFESREKTFEVYLLVEDQSGNTARSESFFVRYVDERVYQEPADTQEERNKAFWGTVAGSVVFGIAVFIVVFLLVRQFKLTKGRAC